MVTKIADSIVDERTSANEKQQEPTTENYSSN